MRTAIAPRKFDDGAVEGSCKAVQDGIADALGIDDGDDRLEWRYDQRKGRVGGILGGRGDTRERRRYDQTEVS